MLSADCKFTCSSNSPLSRFNDLAINQSVGHFAPQTGKHLLNGAGLKSHARLIAEPGRMRGNYYFGMRYKGLSDGCHFRFVFEDIESSAGDSSQTKGVNQCGLINKASPRSIDDRC